MCLSWYHSSVPEARSAGRLRRWPATNFPCALPLSPLPPLSLCVRCHCLFCDLALCALCFPPLLCPAPVSIWGRGSRARLDTFDWSEWQSPSPVGASGQHHIAPYMHKSASVPSPEMPLPPHPASLIFSSRISSGHFVTDQANMSCHTPTAARHASCVWAVKCFEL